MSIAWSRGISRQLRLWGARYFTAYSRSGPLTSSREEAPFGQSRPREIGLSGSPSIWVTTSSWTKTRCPQPTAQNGQTDFTTRASLMRDFNSRECRERTADPRPSLSAPSICRTTGQPRIRSAARPISSFTGPRSCSIPYYAAVLAGWSGWDLHRRCWAPKRHPTVCPQPQIHQRHEPDDRNHDVGHDAAESVECPVQNSDAEIGDDDAPGQTKVAATRGTEDRSTENRRPETMTERG